MEQSVAQCFRRGAWLCAALSLGCGSIIDLDSSTDVAPVPAQPGPSDVVVPTAAQGVESVDAAQLAAQCASGFQACGGLLSGEWSVQGSCEGQTREPEALRAWMSGNFPVDEVACAGALSSGLSSLWSGRLSFVAGVLDDTLQRTEHAELKLGLDCLRATFGVPVRPAQLERVCAELGDASIRCSALGDACSCVLRRDERLGSANLYAVLDTMVAVGTRVGEPPAFIDYCVQEDLLHWLDPETGQRLILRRQPGSRGSLDPTYVR